MKQVITKHTAENATTVPSTMLPDDESWELIKFFLRTAGEWTDEQINNITQEQLEEAVKAINEALLKAHKKSSKLIKQMQADLKELDDAYEYYVMSKSDDNATLDNYIIEEALTQLAIGKQKIYSRYKELFNV